jgi:hypothetical protein
MIVGLVDILTLIAIVVGPIAAVVVTRLMDTRAARYSRKYQVFGDLIRTRAAKISHEHVNALNLVEIEFNRSQRVKAAWDRYMENLSSDFPVDQSSFNNFILRRDQLFIKLVQEIANDIGYKHVDMTDMMTNNYYPKGWQNAEDEQRQLRQLLIAVFSGVRPIPVKMQDNSQWNGPFPPFVGASASGSPSASAPIALPPTSPGVDGIPQTAVAKSSPTPSGSQ